METVYLICFILGLVLSILSVVGGFSHLHIGHIHIGHTAHAHTAHVPTHSGTSGVSSVNGFTITAFLCWFGAAGYLLYRFSSLIPLTVLLISTLSGIIGATFLWAILFKLLLPRERILTAEETEMPGVVAQVSGSIRDNGGIGEIIFSQTGARRSTAARSEDGTPIHRGTEVVVIRYERGVAYVRPFDDSDQISSSRSSELHNPIT